MTTPPLPPGFVLEDDAPVAQGVPPLPPGFELESDEPAPLEIDIVGGTSVPVAQFEAQEQPPSRLQTELRGVGLSARSALQGVGGMIGAIGGDAFNMLLLPGDQPSYRDVAGMLADRIGLHLSFVLPVTCYLYIIFYGLVGSRPRAASGQGG